MFLSLSHSFEQNLRTVFKICHDIDVKSGLGGFDATTGAHVTPESEQVWEDLLRANPAVAPYKNTGWRWWDKMKEILGSPPPRGLNVFHARQHSPVGPRERSSSWVIEDPNQALPDEDIQVCIFSYRTVSYLIVSDFLIQPFLDKDSEGISFPEDTTDHTKDSEGVSFSEDTTDHVKAQTQDREPELKVRMYFVSSTPLTLTFESQPLSTPKPLPSARPGKRTAATATPSTVKRPRTSTGITAVGVIGSAMDRFTDAMIEVLAPPVQPQAGPSTVGTPRSSRRQIAIGKIEQEEWLTEEDQIEMIEMFERDGTLVDSYLSFTRPALREAWLNRKLRVFRGAYD